jgi:hypothetical protein
MPVAVPEFLGPDVGQINQHIWPTALPGTQSIPTQFTLFTQAISQSITFIAAFAVPPLTFVLLIAELHVYDGEHGPTLQSCLLATS